MPEEVILLVRQGHAYVVNDVVAHRQGLAGASVNAAGREGRLRWKEWLDGKGREVANARRAEKERDMRRALQANKMEEKGPRKDVRDSHSAFEDQPTKNLPLSSPKREDRTTSKLVEDPPHDVAEHQPQTNDQEGAISEPESDGGFDGSFALAADIMISTPQSHPARPKPKKPPPMSTPPPKHTGSSQPLTPPKDPPSPRKPQEPLKCFPITPTTSHPPLPLPSPQAQIKTLLPPTPKPYPLYAYLHNHPTAYFVSPGLRFGADYLVYPGDPLRFHSHFLAVGREWDEEVELLTLIGGGRLGTGVKKGFLVGGKEGGGGREGKSDDGDNDGEGVRCFCIEWGGM